jgi:hypothetical protein
MEKEEHNRWKVASCVARLRNYAHYMACPYYKNKKNIATKETQKRLPVSRGNIAKRTK